MINPKDFYRKLDVLLTDIYQVKSKGILSNILRELLDFLGNDLHIVAGRLYEEDVNSYNLIISTGNEKYAPIIQKTDKSIDLILKHGCYIFNERRDRMHTSLAHESDTIPAAFIVNNEEKHWIFIFNLGTGWEREEIELSLNTVRKLLNYRISTEHFKNYIHQAVLIQQSLLPTKLPEIEGFDLAARSIATEIVGGDLYDFMVFDKDYFGVAIGDASGHGLPAALLVRDVVTGLRMGLEKHLKMPYALQKLNQVIHRSRLSTSFISLFYAEIETNGNLIYVNAGHPTPLLVKEFGIEEFTIGGMVLGPLPEVQLKRGFNIMDKGDVLLLYSDGLIERQNSAGEPFEIERLKQLALEKKSLPACQILDAIIEEAYNFGDNEKWADDVTLVIIKKLS